MHWMTTNYIVHKELGAFYDKLDELNDRLVESYLGSTQERLNLRDLTLPVLAPSESLTYEQALLNIKRQFKGLRDNLDSALQNVIDEITGAIDQTLYLIKLK
jgi:hypothetical protein